MKSFMAEKKTKKCGKWKINASVDWRTIQCGIYMKKSRGGKNNVKWNENCGKIKYFNEKTGKFHFVVEKGYAVICRIFSPNVTGLRSSSMPINSGNSLKFIGNCFFWQFLSKDTLRSKIRFVVEKLFKFNI